MMSGFVSVCNSERKIRIIVCGSFPEYCLGLC